MDVAAPPFATFMLPIAIAELPDALLAAPIATLPSLPPTLSVLFWYPTTIEF